MDVVRAEYGGIDGLLIVAVFRDCKLGGALEYVDSSLIPYFHSSTCMIVHLFGPF